MDCKRRLLLLSGSRLTKSDLYYQWAADEIRDFLKKSNVKRVLFIPYALSDHQKYTEIIKASWSKLNMSSDIQGIESFPDPVEEAKKAEAFFIGGGNTFRLLKTLYDNKLIDIIQSRVLEEGIPYIGSSAGTNVSTISINTTNDMPIVYPPSFDALRLVPFNINPHYIEPDPASTHMGETRVERINQYHEIEGSHPVLGLPDGTYLSVEGDKAVVKGVTSAYLFTPGQPRKAFPAQSDLSALLKS